MVLRRRLVVSSESVSERTRARLGPLAGRLQALSPLAILSRGYALAWKMPEETLVRRAAELAEGDEIRLRLGEGQARAAVTQIEESVDG